MAWYCGTYRCGCEGRVNITGRMKDRQWKVDRAFSKLCIKCYYKRRNEEIEKANYEAAKKAEEMNLPELIGSEKQIIWANTIRVQIFDILDKMLEKLEVNKKMYIADCIIQQYTEAKFWINNRTHLQDIITDFVNKKQKTL